MVAVRVVPFVVVVLAPVAASWHGLVAVGHEWLGLGSWAPVVPLSLDAAALYAAVLSWKATLDGDAAGIDRLLVWVYAAASGGLNAWHADATGGLPAACFYGAMSVSAAVVWERTLRAARRRELRALGAIDSPAPRFRWLRWVLWPRETAGAWRLAIGEGIPDARRAIELYRVRRAGGQWRQAPLPDAAPARPTTKTKTPKRETPKTTPSRPPAAPDAVPVTDPELSGLSKTAATRRALAATGGDVPEALDWLKARGLKVDRSGAYKVKKSMGEDDAPRLVAVGQS